jgi:hypothetical protein
MNKSKLAAAIRRHWDGTQTIPLDKYESKDDATIRDYLRCPDCNEYQHDLDYEDVQELIASVDSLAEFDAAFIAAVAENAERLRRAWRNSAICIDDLPPGEQERLREQLAEVHLLNAQSPSRLLN